MDYLDTLATMKSSSPCPACDKQSVYERWIDDDFQYGVGEQPVTLHARIPLCHCGSCGLEFTDYRAEELRHKAICEHLNLLTPNEIVAIRERHGMSQQAFAELSRFGRASLARWESGSSFQNGSADSLLYLLCFEDNVERLARRFKEPAGGRGQEASEQARRFRSLNLDAIERYRCEAAVFRLHVDA